MDESIADAIRSIYTSVLDEGHWERALDALVEVFGARGAVIVMQEKGLEFGGFNAISAHYRNSADVLDTYNRDYVHHEASAWLEISRREPGELFIDTEEGKSCAQIDAQPHYAYTLEHLAVRRRIGFRISDNPAWSDGIAFAYDASVAAAPPRAAQTARLILPHLSQAIELGRAFSLLRQRYQAVVAALDRMHVGIAIVTSDGEVLAFNSEAGRMFDESDAIRMGRDARIIVADPEKGAQLQGILQHCTMIAQGRNETLTAPLHLDRPEKSAPLLLSVTALRGEGEEIEADLAATVLMMIDMARPPALDVEGFARLHGLTPAETEVLSFMVEGDNTAVIAEKRSTSPHTAHNQARAVLTKTKCRNRNQLVRLVVQTLPPIF